MSYLDEVYFEKVIEWIYVSKYLGNNFGMPLAGKREKIGDAIISDGSKLVIIEFKREYENIVSEKSKYELADQLSLDAFDILKISYALDYRKRNQPSYEPHVLVHGCSKKINENGIDSEYFDELKAIYYWGSWCSNKGRNLIEGDIKDCIEDKQIDVALFLVEEVGYSPKKFEEYLKLVVAAKGGADQAAQGIWKYANVLGITGGKVRGATCSVMSLWNFAITMKMTNLANAFEKAHMDEANNNPAGIPRSRFTP